MLSVVLSVLLFAFPGALAMVLWIGAYAMVFGALLVALSLRLRSIARTMKRNVSPGGSLPTDGFPRGGVHA